MLLSKGHAHKRPLVRAGSKIIESHAYICVFCLPGCSALSPAEDPQLREFLDEFAKDMVRVGTRLEDTMAEGMKQEA